MHVRLGVYDKHPGDMTLRELRDTVNNWVLSWNSMQWGRGAMQSGNLIPLVDSCFHRFGELAWVACRTQDEVLILLWCMFVRMRLVMRLTTGVSLQG